MARAICGSRPTRHLRSGVARRIRWGRRYRRRPLRNGRRGRRRDGSGSDRHHRRCHVGPPEFAGRPAGGTGLRRAHRRGGAVRRPEARQRPRIRHCRVCVGRRCRGGAAAACLGQRVRPRRRQRRRRHGRTADPYRLLPAAGPGRAHRCTRRGRAGLEATRGGPRRDRAGRRGRRAGPLDTAHRHRIREGSRAVRQADRQLPGGQAHVRRDAAAFRAGRSGRG